MKQLIRLLFLCLAVVFSFGFTVTTSSCGIENTEPHSCCQKAEKETKTPKCEGDCCFQTTGISKLEDLELIHSASESVKRVLSSKSNVYFSSLTLCGLEHKKQIVTKLYSAPVLVRPTSLAIVSQCWLI